MNNKKERLEFCLKRDMERKTKSEEICSQPLPKHMVKVKCKNCGNPFYAKTADRKRGWGKFCSKSCKAQAR
jgi:hypothetical protein